MQRHMWWDSISLWKILAQLSWGLWRENTWEVGEEYEKEVENIPCKGSGKGIQTQGKWEDAGPTGSCAAGISHLTQVLQFIITTALAISMGSQSEFPLNQTYTQLLPSVQGGGGVTSFGKNIMTCGLHSIPQIQTDEVKTENKALSALRDSVQEHKFTHFSGQLSPDFLLLHPLWNLQNARSCNTDSVQFIPSSEQCSPIWFPDFVGDNLNDCHWYFLGLHGWVFAQCFYQLMSFFWEKKKLKSRFRLNHCDTNEQLPPAWLCGLNRLNWDIFSS